MAVGLHVSAIFYMTCDVYKNAKTKHANDSFHVLWYTVQINGEVSKLFKKHFIGSAVC